MLKAEASREVSELTAKLEEERDTWRNRKDTLLKDHAQEVFSLKQDAAELEANLRAQMVAEKAKADQETEEVRDT